MPRLDCRHPMLDDPLLPKIFPRKGFGVPIALSQTSLPSDLVRFAADAEIGRTFRRAIRITRWDSGVMVLGRLIPVLCRGLEGRDSLSSHDHQKYKRLCCPGRFIVPRETS